MNKLARYIIIAAVIAIVAFLCWYFRSVLTFILLAAVVSLIGRPLVNALTRLKIGKRTLPRSVAAVLTLLVMVSVIIGVSFFLVPLVSDITASISAIDFKGVEAKITEPLAKYNIALHKLFPALEEGATIQHYLWEGVKGLIKPGVLSSVFGSVTSFFVNFGIAFFSTLFISFFFLKDPNMFTNLIKAFVPDRNEIKISRAMTSVNDLLMRYFLGLIIEIAVLTIVSSLGLTFIARFNFGTAIVLGFAFGILNIIPYVGPLFGGTLGVVIGVATHFGTSGFSSLFWFIVTIILIYVGTNSLDTYLIQPYIYSNSVKAHPLEIFIVILMAGYIGGATGMLIAIPCYTVVRVFASEFLSQFKIVQKITSSFKATP